MEYLVVINAEEQHSIWLADRELPVGWRSEGFRGSKADCLAHIERAWTDMRPASLRRLMDDASAAELNAPSHLGDEPR